jgi:hypothetical protein
MMVRMNPYPEGEDPDQPLTAKVCRELRNRIIASDLAPGARPRERDLAHDLGSPAFRCVKHYRNWRRTDSSPPARGTGR